MAQDRSAAEASAVDLAEFEKFFREQFAAPASGAEAPHKPLVDDPLMAELARIVGQDVRPATVAAPPRLPVANDPFTPASPAPQGDPLKAFEEELRRFDAEREAARLAASRAAEPELRGVQGDMAGADFNPDPRQQTVQGGPPLASGHHEPLDLPGDSLAIPPELVADPAEDVRPRSRKVMILLSLAGVVALVGVVVTLGFGGGSKQAGGQPPVIAAKTSPTKEKPADPGGVEISGQDRQVLSKRSEEPKTPATVVNKEEQPVDLNQTPKREAARVIMPPTAGQPGAPAAPILMPSGTQPAPQAAPPQSSEAPAAPAAGVEPRRVRSVRVTGDGEVAQPATPPVAASVPPKNEARPATAARTASATPSPTTPQPARPAPARPAPAAAPSGDGPLSLRPPAGTRPAPPAPTTSAGAATGGSGGFAVQMKASPTAADARSAAADLKRRHSGVLGSFTPGVREGTVNGRTVYRVRVSGLSREAATELCTRLKADGGSCFVAGN